jgi:eukaryotic-like serine/threonine-protein kinase
LADLPDRLTAALADRYRLERELGQGGMATVYLAQDLKHDRKVAVKVLRPELAAVIGAERFLSEIKTTANLQHPHILPLFDSGEAGKRESGEGTFLYYVMPYVEGESLRDRLNREKQLPINDAVRIATEVASALDYAHRHGVIHRDIKPENILLHDSRALVADFGIALAASKAGGTRMTETGMSLGTPHYMSPEQAMGEREITARSDVYALGAMTYEMLVGDPPFLGGTAQAVVAKVLTEKPAPPSRARDTVSEAVDEAVLTALAKLPADRFATAAEFAAALAGPASSGAGKQSVSTRARPHGPAASLPLLLALIATAILAALGWSRAGRSTTPEVIRFQLLPAPGTRLAFPAAGIATYLALSPDGRQAVYAAWQGGSEWVLYIRNFDELTPRSLPGTEGAAFPEFSPDGRWVAFGSPDGTLKKIAVDGTSITTICQLDAGGLSGLTWTSDKEIVLTRENLAARGLWRVPSDGGQPVQFSSFDSASGERLQLAPRAADHGRLVFYGSTRASTLDIKIGVVTTKDGKPKVLSGLRGARVLGLADDFLIYVRADGALMAAPFDLKKLEAGPPLQVFDSIAARYWLSPAALSASGSLLYQRGGLASQLVRVDLHGLATPLLDVARVYMHPRLSPDGRRIAFESQEGAGNEIWIADIAAQTAEKLTRGGFNDRPEWTPDGRRVMYVAAPRPANSLWWQPADGSGSAELVYQGPDAIREGVFTPDGRTVIYRMDTPDSNRDIYALPLAGERTPVPLLTSIDDDKQPRVSPDGRWLAYVSNQSGREEVYVRPLTGAGARVAVSTGGGGEPLWARDGTHLYYRAGGWLLAARVVTSPSFAVLGRDTLFDAPYTSDLFHANYDVAPDGKSFVMIRPVEQERQLIMVVNWIEELRQRTKGAK